MSNVKLEILELINPLTKEKLEYKIYRAGDLTSCTSTYNKFKNYKLSTEDRQLFITECKSWIEFNKTEFGGDNTEDLNKCLMFLEDKNIKTITGIELCFLLDTFDSAFEVIEGFSDQEAKEQLRYSDVLIKWARIVGYKADPFSDEDEE